MPEHPTSVGDVLSDIVPSRELDRTFAPLAEFDTLLVGDQ